MFKKLWSGTQKALGLNPSFDTESEISLKVSVVENKLCISFNKPTDHIYLDRLQAIELGLAINQHMTKVKKE